MRSDRAARILIVDDDPDITSLTRLLLEEIGYSVMEANTGRDAVVLAEAETFDVVLLDVVMPRMSGAEVMVRLQALPRPPAVLAMTGSYLSKARALADGFRGVLLKPVDIDDLVAAIEGARGTD